MPKTETVYRTKKQAEWADKHPDYAALGIFPETWACVGVDTKANAQAFLFDLAQQGVPALVSRDADGKRWHISVQGGLALNPVVWLTTLRGAAEEYIVTCEPNQPTQHVRSSRG